LKKPRQIINGLSFRFGQSEAIPRKPVGCLAGAVSDAVSEEIHFNLMNTKPIKYFLGIAVATSCMLVTAAKADVLNYSVSYGSSNAPLSAPFSGTYSLPTFDTTLGTLTSVSLNLSSFDIVSAEIINFSNTPQSYGGASATLPITVTALDGLNTTSTGSASYGAGIANAGPFVITVLPGQATADTASATLNSGFSDFETIGGQLFNLSIASGAGQYSISDAPSSLAVSGAGTSYGTVSVQYNFTPVPEPTTLALAGLGGFATLLVARRRK
jgi:hypothetical protein